VNFTDNEKILLSSIVQANPTSITLAVSAAYEAGIAQGTANASVAFKALLATMPQSVTSAAPSDSNDDGPGIITPADAAWLRAQGIDPNKKFRVKNSLFTITGVKRSRWKFPISASNQNGTCYKFPIAHIKRYQGV
jgi:hypothetical protein